MGRESGKYPGSRPTTLSSSRATLDVVSCPVDRYPDTPAYGENLEISLLTRKSTP